MPARQSQGRGTGGPRLRIRGAEHWLWANDITTLVSRLQALASGWRAATIQETQQENIRS